MSNSEKAVLFIVAIIAIYLYLYSKGKISKLLGGTQGGTFTSGPNKGQPVNPLSTYRTYYP
jgi:hypothetical protein